MIITQKQDIYEIKSVIRGAPGKIWSPHYHTIYLLIQIFKIIATSNQHNMRQL